MWFAPAVAALDEVPSLNLLAIPALLTMSGDAYRREAAAAARYAASRRAFLILDPPADATTVDAIVQSADDLGDVVGASGALYWPALVVDSVTVAPSQAVAAVYRDADQSGVWTIPAGSKAVLPGVPSIVITEAQQELLRNRSVNVIRSLPRFGTIIWGGRTLARDRQYVPVRRLLLFVESSVVESLRDAVLEEPNAQPLWTAVVHTVSAFLADLWRAGALQGRTSREAFFVSCDAATMTQDDIANGRLIVTIGFAPLRPAEFVILRIALTARTP